MKDELKGKIKKVLIQKILLPVLSGFLIIILLAGFFLSVIEGIKDAVDGVLNTVGSVFSNIFDNNSNMPILKIDDKLIDSIKESLKKSAISIDETYLTDDLLKESLKAYYATQFPYIEGPDYNNDKDIVKGCIYLKRSGDDNNYLKFIGYNSFKDKLGENKSSRNVEDAKKYFSADDNGNLVVATWSKSSTVTEIAGEKREDGGDKYLITEYKIDHKSITSQYAMSYKLPILLANLYSNEGFGKAVAKLGIDSRIELTICDSTVETITTEKEYFKLNFKATGTCNWKEFDEDALKSQVFEDYTWLKDYTQEGNAYRVQTTTTEENSITVKPTLLDTFTVKGEVTNITKKVDENSTTNKVETENNPKDFTVDQFTMLTEEQKYDILQKIAATIADVLEASKILSYYAEHKDETIDAIIYKQMTDHLVETTVNSKTEDYTFSEMGFVDNTDKFLALIRANEDGEFDKKGELVKYTKRSKDKKADVEKEFVTSVDLLVGMLEKDSDLSNYANTMKYMYYKYTNDESYRTELDFSSYNMNEFNDVEISYTSENLATEFLKAWENGAIRDYINGTSKWSTYVSKFITQDKKYYICYHDYNDDRGDRNYAYGVCHTPNINEGIWWRTEEYKNKKIGGISINIKEQQYNTPGTSKIEVEKVDAVFSEEVKSKRNYVKTILKQRGINDLEDYQIEALTTVAYQYGNIGNFCEMYKKYGNTAGLRDNTIAKQGNHYFTTGRNETNGRPQAVWRFFHEGKCINQRSEEIKVSSDDSTISTEVGKILKYKNAQAYKLVCGQSSLPTVQQFSHIQADKMMKTIQVPIRVWSGKDLNTKIIKKNLTINKNLEKFWIAFFTDLSNIKEFVIDPNTLYGYCYRARTSGSTLSAHALGTAVDINPNIQGNGYGDHVMTKGERDALGKNNKIKYQTIYKGSPMQKLAEKYTLSWGGAWSSTTDAMHFSYVGDGTR